MKSSSERFSWILSVILPAAHSGSAKHQMTQNFFKTQCSWIKSLALKKCQWNFREVILKQILITDVWVISYEIGPRWMPLDITDDKPNLVQVMAWCRQATSHYLSQFWPDLCRHMASIGHNEFTHYVLPQYMKGIQPRSSLPCTYVLTANIIRSSAGTSLTKNNKFMYVLTLYILKFLEGT